VVAPEQVVLLVQPHEVVMVEPVEAGALRVQVEPVGFSPEELGLVVLEALLVTI
jgi:hypothetical protein